jgi:hypothetical protein
MANNYSHKSGTVYLLGTVPRLHEYAVSDCAQMITSLSHKCFVKKPKITDL